MLSSCCEQSQWPNEFIAQKKLRLRGRTGNTKHRVRNGACACAHTHVPQHPNARHSQWLTRKNKEFRVELTKPPSPVNLVFLMQYLSNANLEFNKNTQFGAGIAQSQ
jgi:hypothetical protein